MHGRILAAAAAAFVIAGTAGAQQPQRAEAQAGTRTDAGSASAATGTAAAQGQAGQGQVAGRVAMVDASAHELAIDTGGATTQIRVKDDAEITVNGARASFDQLKQGVDVRATLDRSGETPMATRIEATSKQKK